jgi:hypothetical protein
MATQLNKGTGAGGANTNFFGKGFEEKTNNFKRLEETGYTRTNLIKNATKDIHHSLSKTEEGKTITCVSQGGFKVFMKTQYGKELYRCPDEAYILEYSNGQKVIKILEKKEQHVEGSVETKLWAGPAFKEEYEFELDGFEIWYGFCVNDYLKKKIISTEQKYMTLNKIFTKHNIHVLFGDDEDYYSKLDEWINS